MAKILFETVNFDFTIQRLGSTKGVAATSTEFFSASKMGLTIELDTDSGLVTVRHVESGESRVIPRERVKYLTPIAEAPAPAEEKRGPGRPPKVASV